jgi:TctA family transporter
MIKRVKLTGIVLSVICVPAVFLFLCKREYRAALIIITVLVMVITFFIQKKYRGGGWE